MTQAPLEDPYWQPLEDQHYDWCQDQSGFVGEGECNCHNLEPDEVEL